MNAFGLHAARMRQGNMFKALQAISYGYTFVKLRTLRLLKTLGTLGTLMTLMTLGRTLETPRKTLGR